jgi:mRNA interferase MazF
MKHINQGDIYLANLNPVKGHEQSGLRPVLILQCNLLNQELSTVIVAPITSNMRLKGFMTTHFLSKRTSKLKQDSLVLLFQVRTIDRSRLVKEMGHISAKEFVFIRGRMLRMFY